MFERTRNRIYKTAVVGIKTNSTDSPSLQNLDAHFIKDVLNYVSGDFDKLQQMGSSFPELEVVKNYKNDNTALDGFPETIKQIYKGQMQNWMRCRNR